MTETRTPSPQGTGLPHAKTQFKGDAMSMFVRSLSTLALVGALGSLSAQAEDFGPLMNVAKQTWPEKTRIGVICDYSKNMEAVHQLALAAGSGRTLVVMDTHHASEIPTAQQRLAQQKTDFIVLMPQDPLVRDGSFDATVLVGHLAVKGIPTIATSAIAIKQGALFSIGEATKGELIVCSRPIGTVRVIMPNKTEIAQTTTNATSAQVLIMESRL